MIKKTIAGIIVANVLIGCGGGSGGGSSSPEDKMSKKDGIFIIYNYQEATCKSKTLFREMQTTDGVKDLLVQVASNNVSCAVYDKNQNNCTLMDGKHDSSLSCVIGFDKDNTDNINNKLSYDNKPMLIEKIREKIILISEE
jgi:hypothetical protein